MLVFYVVVQIPLNENLVIVSKTFYILFFVILHLNHNNHFVCGFLKNVT